MSKVTSAVGELDENSRKRIRKGTSSCWECKRRKVRCQFRPDNVSICNGCATRGTTCMSQEFSADHIPPRGTQIGERLGRVESLLQHLVRKVDALEPGPNLYGDKDLTDGSDDDGLSIHGDLNGNRSVLELLNHAVGSKREATSQLNEQGVSQETTPGNELPSKLSPRMEKIRKSLAALLPTQRDVDLIGTATNAWALNRALCASIDELFCNQASPFSSFNLTEVSQRHPTIVARTLLYISLCIQQLPTEFPPSSLSLGPDLDVVVHRYTSTVSTLVLGDDELVDTMEGLECLMLLSVFHINAGNLRRAWLPSRKALSVAQMKGLHKDLSRISTSMDPTTAVNGKKIWYRTVDLDRYLAIVLGLPVGSKDDRFSPDETLSNPNIDQDDIFTRRLCIITGAIIDRNEGNSSNAFATTQEIDERLDSLRKEMREGFWDIPTTLELPRSASANEHFERLIHQMWFFQLEGFLHLPFMLRAATEHRYDYNKSTCLRASRELIFRYLALRQASTISLCCRVADFAGFIAAVILMLDVVSYPQKNESRETQIQRNQDRDLIRQLLSCLEHLARNPRDVVAAQSIIFLKTMLGESESSLEQTRLRIPYLGTITILRQQPKGPQLKQHPPYVDTISSMKPSPETMQTRTGSEPQNTIAETQLYDGDFNSQISPDLKLARNMEATPGFSFKSSHFAADFTTPGMDMDWLEGDSYYFDSLLSTDLGGLEYLESSQG